MDGPAINPMLLGRKMYRGPLSCAFLVINPSEDLINGMLLAGSRG